MKERLLKYFPAEVKSIGRRPEILKLIWKRPFSIMISLLRRCTGSLNQMAKRMNKTGRVYDVDLREAMEQQERLWTMANALLIKLAGIR